MRLLKEHNDMKIIVVVLMFATLGLHMRFVEVKKHDVDQAIFYCDKQG